MPFVLVYFVRLREKHDRDAPGAPAALCPVDEGVGRARTFGPDPGSSPPAQTGPLRVEQDSSYLRVHTACRSPARI